MEPALKPDASPGAATTLAEVRTDVRPFLWGIGSVLLAGLAATGVAMAGAIPLPAGLATLGAALLIAMALAARGLGRRAVVYRVTTQRIEIERGYLGKRYESIDLFRVKDVVLEQSLVDRMRNVGTVTIYSTDQVEPVLAIGPVPDAKALFERLRDRAAAARRTMGAAVLQ